MSAAETPEPQHHPAPSALPSVSMRELLASCAAAAAVSRPPREPEPDRTSHDTGRRAAA
ncbi:hypothetical protein [Streptomyces sp. Ru71]|uniref:hypothetical protein n=1 Tax=Streptomyces sp. Ru71 TaxID=2080746 RepID=UPI0015E33510|nr:hypothetical protein [Streptomyces sp. Ru71]